MKLAAFLCVLFLAVGAHAERASKPAEEKHETLAQIKAKELAQTVAEVASLPVIEGKRIEDVVKLTIREKDLVVTTTLPPTDDTRVIVPGMPGIARVKYSPGNNAPNQPPAAGQFSFENRDYTVPYAVATFTSVSDAAGTVTLAQDWETADDQLYSVQLLQHGPQQPEGEPHVSMYVRITEPLTDLRINANSIVDLRREHPAEAAKYLDPILRALKQEGLLARVDPKLAWQVFADAYKPSPPLLSQIDAAVKKLDADDFQQREAASKQLEALGQDAALALRNRDRRGLSEEQRTRLDAFLAKFKTVPEPEAARLRQDRDFLLDCLACEDQGIRARALAELRKITGRPIAFDPAADEQTRLAAIVKLRDEVGAPTTRDFKSPTD